MKYNQQQAIELIDRTVQQLNQVIYKKGEILANDREIWGTTLNVWRNQDWLQILETMAQLQASHPEMFKDNHLDAFEAAAEAIQKHWSRHDRVLDTKGHKKTAWQSLMALREVWNQCQGVYLPNGGHKTAKPQQRANIFEINDV